MSRLSEMDYKEGVKNTFSFSKEATQWSILYEHPSDLFEWTMLQRRNYVLGYILKNAQPSAKILDLGCGTGVLTEKLLNHGMNVVSMDLSPDMLSLAHQKVKAYPQRKSLLLQADSETLPFHDKHFDLVACLGVIAFLKDERQAIAEMSRIIQPHGTLILSFRNKRTLSTLLDPIKLIKIVFSKLSASVRSKKTRSSKSNPEDVSIPRRFDPNSVIGRLKKHGFSVKEVQNFGFGPIKFNEKELFSLDFSVKLNNFFDKLFNIRFMNALKRSSDVCVLVLEKK